MAKAQAQAPKDIEVKAKPAKCEHGIEGSECFDCFDADGKEKPKVETKTEPKAEEKPPETPPVEKKVANPIELQRGVLMPKNAVELGAALTIIAAGGGFPERFKTKEQRIAVYNIAQSLMGSQWQLAVNNIAIIKGQMLIYGELPGTLAERTGLLKEKHVFLVDKDHKKICLDNKNLNAEPYAAICRIQKIGRELKEFTWTLEQARTAGQYPPTKTKWENNKPVGQIPNEDSPWHKHLGTMLMRKAQALGVKFEVPEAMVGVPYSDDIYDAGDIDRVEREVNTEATGADLLRKNFGTATTMPNEVQQ